MGTSLALLQLVDSAFPTGAFAHSFGLETAVQEGEVDSVSSLLRWLEDCLYGSLATLDGPGVLLAYNACASRDGAADMEMVAAVDHHLTLARLALESREGAMKIGKQYLRMVLALYKDVSLAEYAVWVREGRCFGHAAIVHGCICRSLQYDRATAVQTYLYQTLNVLVQNAQRVAAIGQTGAQQVMRSLIPPIEAVTRGIVQSDPRMESLAGCAVLQEIAAMRHEGLYSRLFMS